MNMFKPVKPTTVESYLAAVPSERKDLVVALHDFIQETVPSLTPHFAYNMLGYGSFPYTNYKKQQVEWPIVALANQKNYVSLYVCALEQGSYLAEKYKKELGSVSVGKSCIRFKKLSDLNMAGLAKVLKLAEKQPGLTKAA